MATPSRLCHHPRHRSHLRHQLGSRAGVLGKRVLRTLGSSSPTTSRTRASATNGWSMTGRCSFVSFSVIPSYVPWTVPLPPSVPPGGALHTATSRAPRACFAVPTASTSFRVGTRRTSTRPLMYLPQRQAPRRWAQPSALASTSMHERGSQCHQDSPHQAMR